MRKVICVKNIYNCNLNCWFCSTCGEGFITKEDILTLYTANPGVEFLLIGGEPFLLGPEYYLWLLTKGVRFSIQTNLTLYTPEWDVVLSHPNFCGLSVSGDKFESAEAFLGVYQSVSTILTRPTQVLILMDQRTPELNLKKCLKWVSIAKNYGFTLKINYIISTGRASGKNLLLSQAYDIYSTLIDIWREGGFPHVNPFEELLEQLSFKGPAICPYIPNCLSTKGVSCIEVDKRTYTCPVLGDLRKDHLNITTLSPECLTCELYPICMPCANRVCTLQQSPDPAYCASFKRFYYKLISCTEEFRNVRERVTGIC